MHTCMFFVRVGRSAQFHYQLLGVVYIYSTDRSDVDLLTKLSEKLIFWSFCLRSFSCFCCSDSFSPPAVASGPRRACWGLCVGPNEGRRGPSLYKALGAPRLGTLSAYSPKIHRKGVPKSQTQQVSKESSLFEISSKSFDPTHFVGLIHRLVVETCADDIKRRHGDGHGHSAEHGGHQSSEPAVRTESLWAKHTWAASYFPCAAWRSVTCHVPGKPPPSPWRRRRSPAEWLIPPWLEALPHWLPSRDPPALLSCRWLRRHRTPPEIKTNAPLKSRGPSCELIRGGAYHMVMLVTYSNSFHSLSLQVGLDLWRKHTLN